jgi:hypothetical protein
MGASIYPQVNPKTRFVLTLTSGTSWTVPSGVTYVNVTLRGGGGGGAGGFTTGIGRDGNGGQVVTSTLATTPGASITYAIGAGGTGSTGAGNTGGTTTFTGATSATGGNGANTLTIAGQAGTASLSAANGGAGGGMDSGTEKAGGTGGAGSIDVEYWV